MFTIRNAAPRAIFRGIRDASGRPLDAETIQVPTHLPHIFLFTERGGLEPTLVNGNTTGGRGASNQTLQLYGSRSFDPNSQYFTHQSLLANVVLGTGNTILAQRLIPPGANPSANLRFCVDVLEENIPQYQRDENGQFIYNEDNELIPTGDTVPGVILRWFTEPVTPLDEIGDGRTLDPEDPALMMGGKDRVNYSAKGEGTTRVGSMTNGEGEQSTIYPIMDFEVSNFGTYGNYYGVRISTPTTNSTIPINDFVAEDQHIYPYRISFIERNRDTNTTRPIDTLWGDPTIDFSFKEDAIDRRSNMELYINRHLPNSYMREAFYNFPEVTPPVRDVYIYRNNLNMLLNKLQQAEAPHGLVSDDPEHSHQMNMFTAHDIHGVPYYAVSVKGPSEDGILFSANSTHYFQGGFDGHISLETFDKLVRYELEHYHESEYDLTDMAKYPVSILYDTGFTYPTKLAFFNAMSSRPDLSVVISTQDVLGPPNSQQAESSLAYSLRTAARVYPESIIYGTSTCRALIVGHCGYLVSGTYNRLVTMTVDLAQKFARMMGSGSGRWQEQFAVDMMPNNRVTMLRGVNVRRRSAANAARDWDNALVWVQNYDLRSLFYPAIQTVYDDDTSVLNNALTMFAATHLQKVAYGVWRDLTGNASLSPSRLISISNALIERRTEGVFGNRFRIQPETYLTQMDEMRGYSWSCNIHLFASNMKTVGSFTIVTHRLDN